MRDKMKKTTETIDLSYDGMSCDDQCPGDMTTLYDLLGNDVLCHDNICDGLSCIMTWMHRPYLDIYDTEV